MKHTQFFLAFVVAAALCSCEKGKNAEPIKNAQVSFEYREVVNDLYDNHKVEFRNTSTPADLKAYSWRFNGDPTYDAAPAANYEEFWHYFATIGTRTVVLTCKDANAFLYTDTFSISITGVLDSIWKPATPIQ